MGAQLQRALEKQGMTFRLETAATGVERDGAGVRVTLESKAASEPPRTPTSCWSRSVGGRTPTGSGARELGVAFDERGRIVVNEHFETSVPGVFAIGDVHPRTDAGAQGRGRGHRRGRADGRPGRPRELRRDSRTSSTPSPELASVGLTEEAGEGSGPRGARSARFPFLANARARAAWARPRAR